MQLIFCPLTEKGNSTALDSGPLEIKVGCLRESDIPGLEHESESESHLSQQQ